jgi:hypothetical protein
MIMDPPSGGDIRSGAPKRTVTAARRGRPGPSADSRVPVPLIPAGTQRHGRRRAGSAAISAAVSACELWLATITHGPTGSPSTPSTRRPPVRLRTPRQSALRATAATAPAPARGAPLTGSPPRPAPPAASRSGPATRGAPETDFRRSGLASTGPYRVNAALMRLGRHERAASTYEGPLRPGVSWAGPRPRVGWARSDRGSFAVKLG